jgi:antitoxin VapB
VELTGQSLTDAIKKAVAQALDQAQANQVLHQPCPLVDRLNEIALRCAALPDYDQRSADEILAYDNSGFLNTSVTPRQRLQTPFKGRRKSDFYHNG